MSGDVPDLYTFILGFTDHAIGALTSCDVAGISHDQLEQITRRFPNIARALWRESLIDAAIAREWLTGLGRRDAYARVAHLICEQYHRMKAVGLAQKDMLEFPVRQAEIADALGLSTVHVNRTMKSLSRDRLISYRNQSITILNWQALQTVGQFDPAYLHSPDGGSPTSRDEIQTRGNHAVGLLSTPATRQRRLMGLPLIGDGIPCARVPTPDQQRVRLPAGGNWSQGAQIPSAANCSMFC